MDYIIREFKLNDQHEAELLAEMWNASDKGWPGGWTRGITDTADQVLERKKQSDCLAIYVAEYNGKIVGYGDLSAQAGQKDVAHIGLLNVQPEHQGKSVGRRIVQAIINKTIELGYKQLTVGTWPGNTQSVPLYKKTGFFWVPETDVHMQNHIPTILTLPIAKDFFDKHYWYKCFKRELKVEPDEIEWNGIKVFPYHFEADGESLEFIVDVKAESITAIETNELSIACIVGEEEIPVGIEHPVKWVIENKRPDPIQVTLIAEGEEGIALSVLENITVSPQRGDATIEKSFSVAPDIKPKKRGEPAHKTRSTIMVERVAGSLVNVEPLLLESAVKPVQPVDIDYSGQKLVLGKDERIIVTLKNNLDFPVSGKLIIDPKPELKFDRLSADFSIDAKSWTSCEFWAKANDTGSFKTKMKAIGTVASEDTTSTGEKDGEVVDFSTKSTDLFFRAAPFGKIVTTVDDERKRINLESDSMSVHIDRCGGWENSTEN